MNNLSHCSINLINPNLPERVNNKLLQTLVFKVPNSMNTTYIFWKESMLATLNQKFVVMDPFITDRALLNQLAGLSNQCILIFSHFLELKNTVGCINPSDESILKKLEYVNHELNNLARESFGEDRRDVNELLEQSDLDLNISSHPDLVDWVHAHLLHIESVNILKS